MAVNRRSFLSLIAPGAGAALVGCSSRVPFRLAGHPWPGYEPLFLAETQKQLPDAVRLLHFPTVKASIDALKDGGTDGAMVTLDEVLAMRAQGLAVQVILIMDVSKGADAVVAKKEIRSIAQLRGKRVGLEQSTLGELMLSMVLEKGDLRRDEINPVFVPYEAHEAAFKNGELDALISYEPVIARLAAVGVNKLLSTRDLPDAVFDVLAVRTQVAQNYTAALQTTLRGHFLALDQLRRNPWDTAYRMAPHAAVSAEDLIDSFRGLELPDLVANRRYLSAENDNLGAIVKKLSAIMVRSGAIAKSVNAEALFTDVYLPRNLE